MRPKYSKLAPVLGLEHDWRIAIVGFGIILGFGILPYLQSATDSAAVEGGNLRLEFDRNMHSRVIARFGGKDIAMGPFAPSETLIVDGSELKDFG